MDKNETRNRNPDYLDESAGTKASQIMTEHSSAKVLLDATPLACILWSKDQKVIDCNEACLKLYKMKDREEVANRLFDLVPEYQPDGRKSQEVISSMFEKGFTEGFSVSEIELRLLDGTPLPVEITFVRVEYGEETVISGYARDLRQHKQMNERMRILLDAMPYACDLWNKDLKVFDCTEANVRLLGLRNKREFLDHFFDFSPEYQPDGTPSLEKAAYLLKKAFNEDSSFTAEWMHRKLDGTPIPTEITLVRIPYDGEHAVAVYVRDLRGHKKMMGEIERRDNLLEAALEEARGANSAKSNFLARMSHEIRTPLNVVIGLSELTLEAGGLSEGSHSNLEKIYNSGAMLLSIVNDILDISKIEAGKLELIPVDYDIPSLINDALTQSIIRLGEKPVEFILSIDEDLPTRLHGDDLRVKQIISNLLSNACKYTKQGTVEFGMNCERENGTDTVWMTIFVRDTGIGISPEDIENRLFKDYAKMDATSNRAIEGTGLGLPIARMLVELMGGAITVESEYGKGSTFTARFQQKRINDDVIGADVVKNLKEFQHSAGKRTRHSQLVRIRLPYARVLVVDDNATNLDVAKGMLKAYGMKIDCVTGGQQAVDAVRMVKVRYDAIFMDHMMPVMDGIEATRIIREEIGTEYAKTVPIIALTANAIIGNKEMFLNKGFQAFISKPIEITHLDAVIRQWVRNKNREDLFYDKRKEQKIPAGLNDGDEYADGRRHASCGLGYIGGLNTSKGLERFDWNEKLYQRILRSFVTNTRLILETVKVVNEDDLEDYIFAVHGIKASSRGIGADKVGDMAEALEKKSRSGDLDFIRANHPAFLMEADELMLAIDDALSKIAADTPRKDKPDNEILARIRAACEKYDIDGLDAAMAELEAFEYEYDGGLAARLRENVDRMNYEEITDELSSLIDTGKAEAGKETRNG